MKSLCRTFATAACTLVLSGLAACTPKDTKILLEPSQALGTVLAGETVLAAGTKRQVVLILPRWAADSTTGASFNAELKKHGVTVVYILLADVGDPMGRNPLALKSADFFNALEKGAGAGAIVSLAGVPALNAQDIARLNPNHPPVLVAATSSLGNVLGIPAGGSYLTGLLDAKVVQLVIVDGKSEPNTAEPNTKPAGMTDATQQLFFQHFSILRSDG